MASLLTRGRNPAALARMLPGGARSEASLAFDAAERRMQAARRGDGQLLQEAASDELDAAELAALEAAERREVELLPGFTDAVPRKRRRVERIPDLAAYDCRICLSPMTRTQLSVLLPCLHRFCFTCVRRWLRVVKPARCPLCKTDVLQLLYSIYSARDYRVKRYAAEGAVIDLAPVAQEQAGGGGDDDAAGEEEKAAGEAQAAGSVTFYRMQTPPFLQVEIRGRTLSCSVRESCRLRRWLGLPPFPATVIAAEEKPPVRLRRCDDGDGDEWEISVSETQALRKWIGLPPLRL